MHHTGHDFCSIDGAWVTQCFLSSALSLVIVYRGQLRCQQASMEWEMLWQIMADVMSLTAQWLYSIVTIQHTCRSRRSLTSWHKKLLPMLWMLSRARSTSSPIINAYMKLLNKKKECVMRKQNGHTDEDADARDAKDEVSESWLPLLPSALSLLCASRSCYCVCVHAGLSVSCH